MHIWQAAGWPGFFWDEDRLKPQLDQIRRLQGRLLGRADATDEVLQLEMDALIQNAIRSSEIEGEYLDAASVRSSVARHLGIEQAGLAGKPNAESEAMARLLVTATRALADLLAKGYLQQLPGGGCSTRYWLSSQ